MGCPSVRGQFWLDGDMGYLALGATCGMGYIDFLSLAASWRSFGLSALFSVSCRHSCPKVQFDCVDERDEPRQKRLMGWMLKVRVQRGLVLELHDAAKRIASSSWRDVLADGSLKKSWDYPLKSGNVFPGPLLLSFGCSWLPLKRKRVKNSDGGSLRARYVRQFEGKQAACDGGAASSQHGTAG
jgi:hypothetical protein